MGSILKLYPNFVKVYGPYFHSKLGRNVVYLERSGGSRSAVTLARMLMQVKFGRRFDRNETVDHIDDNKANDAIDNLQLLSNIENIKKGKFDSCLYVCPECETEFEKKVARVNSNRRRGSDGPFCSRQCSGKWNRRKTLDFDKTLKG